MGVGRVLSVVSIVGLSAGCLAPVPDFEPSLDRSRVLGGLRPAEVDAFCAEQATYVYNYADRPVYDRARCLTDVIIDGSVAGVDDEASCEAAVERCIAERPNLLWAYTCDLAPLDDVVRATETVGERAECVTESVTIAWAVYAAELDCSMLGDHDAIIHLRGRAYPTGACRAPF